MNVLSGRFRIPCNKFAHILTWDRNNLFAIEKPSGVLSHPNKPSTNAKKTKDYALIEGVYCENGEKYQFKCADSEGKEVNRFVWLINRLDSATSGVILASTNDKTAKIVKKLFKSREVDKLYYALVFGDVAKFFDLKHHGVENHLLFEWEDEMSIVNNNGSNVRASSNNNRCRLSSKLAKTSVRPLEYHPASDTTLMALSPHTGFTHQLRFQCAERGFPIVGDKVYGDFARNKLFADWAKTNGHLVVSSTGDEVTVSSGLINTNVHALKSGSKSGDNANKYKRLFLHSHRIEFSYPSPDPSRPGEMVPFCAESPVPSEFYVGRGKDQ